MDENLSGAYKNPLTWICCTQTSNVHSLISVYVIPLLKSTLATFATCKNMRGSRRKVWSEGVQLWQRFFFVYFFSWWGIEDPNIPINGPPLVRQQNAIEMAFRWRADAGPTLNAGLVALWFFQGILTSIAKNPYILWFFKGGPDPLSPSLDPRLQNFNILACLCSCFDQFGYLLVKDPWYPKSRVSRKWPW